MIKNAVKYLTKIVVKINLVVYEQNNLCNCYEKHEHLQRINLIKVCTVKSSAKVFQRNDHLRRTTNSLG